MQLSLGRDVVVFLNYVTLCNMRNKSYPKAMGAGRGPMSPPPRKHTTVWPNTAPCKHTTCVRGGMAQCRPRKHTTGVRAYNCVNVCIITLRRVITATITALIRCH